MLLQHFRKELKSDQLRDDLLVLIARNDLGFETNDNPYIKRTTIVYSWKTVAQCFNGLNYKRYRFDPDAEFAFIFLAPCYLKTSVEIFKLFEKDMLSCKKEGNLFKEKKTSKNSQKIPSYVRTRV